MVRGVSTDQIESLTSCGVGCQCNWSPLVMDIKAVAKATFKSWHTSCGQEVE